MSPSKEVESDRLFTRGEKCIFAHLVVTFVLILVVIIVYFCHLLLVQHEMGEAFRFTRRSGDSKVKESHLHYVGAMVLRLTGKESIDLDKGSTERVACGCVALRPYWSAAPALCVAARSDPAMAVHLPAWVLQYRLGSGPIHETDIARGIIHSHYNRDDAQNNIGLLEHSRALEVPDYRFSLTNVDDGFLYKQAYILAVAGWRDRAPGSPGDLVVWRYPVTPITWEECRRIMTSITELRSYEVCGKIDVKSPIFRPVPGSALITSADVLGFFSWGDKHGSLPLVILKLENFKGWIETIVN